MNDKMIMNDKNNNNWTDVCESCGFWFIWRFLCIDFDPKKI